MPAPNHAQPKNQLVSGIMPDSARFRPIPSDCVGRPERSSVERGRTHWRCGRDWRCRRRVRSPQPPSSYPRRVSVFYSGSHLQPINWTLRVPKGYPFWHDAPQQTSDIGAVRREKRYDHQAPHHSGSCGRTRALNPCSPDAHRARPAPSPETGTGSFNPAQ